MKFNAKPGTRYLVISGTRALGIRAGERYRSDGQNLVLESSGKRTKVVGPIDAMLRTGLFRECQLLLGYFLVTVSTDGKGRIVSQRYEIPVNYRAKVLRQLWPFRGKPPSLEEKRYDLHMEKLFTVGDFLVYREDETNYLVSPYYPEGDGTVIDWMPADWDEKFH